MSYHMALSALSPKQRQTIEAELAAWKDHAPVADNLRRETALPHDEFVHLLEAFSSALSTPGSDGPGLFDIACRNHKLKGPRVRGTCPQVLGRAIPLNRLADLLYGSDPGISRMQWERLARRHAAQPGKLARLLGRPVPLGRHVIWATFRNPERTCSPFADPLHTRERVRTALGLGEDELEQAWALLVYTPNDATTHDIRIPTVADAGSYRYFCCVADVATEDHGWTRPLEPNPLGLAPQPEVVHAEHTDYRLTHLAILE
jgi:hypothetical protein